MPSLKRNIAIAAATESSSAGNRRSTAPARRTTSRTLNRPGLAEQRVQREPDREVEDHADHRGGDRRQRAGERLVAAQRLDEGRAEEDPEEARREGHPGREQPAERPASIGDSAPGSRKAAMKPTNCSTMISGPGVVSAMPRPSSISPGCSQPIVSRPPAARHRPAPHRRRRRSPPPSCEKKTAIWLKTLRRPERRRAAPRPAPARARARSPRRAATARSVRPRMRRAARRRAGCRIGSRAAWPRHARRRRMPATEPRRADEADQRRRARMISGNGTSKKKIATKAAAAMRDHARRFLQRALADPHHRLEHDRQHRRLEAEEQRRDEADVAVERRRCSSAP